MNPRYRGENILQMELDVPERTTQVSSDYNKEDMKSLVVS